MNLVKVAKLGTAVKEVALELTANVGDALRAAEIEAGGFEIRVNGNPVEATASVRSGDVITLVPQIKGGMNLVKVAKLGSAVKEVALESTATIAQALRAAETDQAGFEIRLNGNPVGTDANVRSGDIVTLVPQIKGGRQ